jgi:hypothetical protein
LSGGDLAALFDLDMAKSEAPAAVPTRRIGRFPQEIRQRRQGHGVEARQRKSKGSPNRPPPPEGKKMATSPD